MAGLMDVKLEISNRFGRPALTVNGSKHLTAAFLTGRVFNRYQLNIRQGDEYWSTAGSAASLDSFAIDYRPGSFARHALTVEIATGHKDIASGVDALIETDQLDLGGRLQVRPVEGRVNVTDPISRSLAQLVYSEIDRTANSKPTTEIHLFAAAPQSTLMTLGTLFQGQPHVHFYEWTARGYVKSIVIPSRLR